MHKLLMCFEKYDSIMKQKCNINESNLKCKYIKYVCMYICMCIFKLATTLIIIKA